MSREPWLDTFAADAATLDLRMETRELMQGLGAELLALWNLGENVLLGWTHCAAGILVLSVPHYAIPESVHARPRANGAMRDAGFLDDLLAGPKYFEPREFTRVCEAFGSQPAEIRVHVPIENQRAEALVSDMVGRYGVSLVRDRAVVLLDAVGFSVQSPLDQMAMLNSLAYSVNSAYAQLLSKAIRIDFARTTTGDGFYIWNRATTLEANTELYKLMMMLLADNAVAQRKARSSWVPKLRAAFHVGSHYEFHQVEGLNPTRFSYIVGQVTVDLSRMMDHALPGQIILGDFDTPLPDGFTGESIRYDALDFVENTAATLDQLNGLDIAGGRIGSIRCYLTGPSLDGGYYLVDRYHLVDKHGMTRTVYNAKINIYRDQAEPIFLGIRSDHLGAFDATKVDRAAGIAR